MKMMIGMFEKSYEKEIYDVLYSMVGTEYDVTSRYINENNADIKKSVHMLKVDNNMYEMIMRVNGMKVQETDYLNRTEKFVRVGYPDKDQKFFISQL